jgi:hypothetical protein
MLTKTKLNLGHNYFVVNLNVKLRSKSNFRIKKENWESYRKFEEYVAYSIKENLPSSWDLGDKELPIAKRPKVLVSIIAQTNVDNGNISKSILDSGEGVIYHNDASVVSSNSITIRGSKEDNIAIGFMIVSENITTEEILEKQFILNAVTLEKFKS